MILYFRPGTNFFFFFFGTFWIQILESLVGIEDLYLLFPLFLNDLVEELYNLLLFNKSRVLLQVLCEIKDSEKS